MLFPVTYFHPADCVLLPNSSSTKLSTFILRTEAYLLPPFTCYFLLPSLMLLSIFYFHPPGFFLLPSVVLLATFILLPALTQYTAS